MNIRIICITTLAVLTILLSGCSEDFKKRVEERKKEKAAEEAKKEEAAATPKSISSFNVSEKGTNGVLVEFKIKSMSEEILAKTIAVKGKLKITIRPNALGNADKAAYPGMGQIIAIIEHDVTEADFTKDIMDNLEFSKKFKMDLKFALMPGITFFLAEAVFTPEGSEASFEAEEKFAHLSISNSE